MKKIRTSFSVCFTDEEIQFLQNLTESENHNYLSISSEEGKFELRVERFNHPVWDFKSTVLEFLGYESEVPDYRDRAVIFLQESLCGLMQADMSRMCHTNEFKADSIETPESRKLLLRFLRPFMFPYEHLNHWLWKQKFDGYLNRELDFLIAWRCDNAKIMRMQGQETLELFLSDDNADLNNSPEVVPAMYLFLDDDDRENPDSLANQVFAKINALHPEDHPGRLRLNVVQSVWNNDWATFLHSYNRIPADMHDWDPVPRYFLPVAIYEHLEDWEATLIAIEELSYFGGIPQYLINSMRGCWEFHRENFEAALTSKQEAFRSGIAPGFVSIQIAVILNKLERYAEAVAIFSNDILLELSRYDEEKDLDSAMTQAYIALKSLDSEQALANFKSRVSETNERIQKAFEKAETELYTSMKNQSALERALEGCQGVI